MAETTPAPVKASMFFNRCADILTGGTFSAPYFEEVIRCINTLRQIAKREAEREAEEVKVPLQVVEDAPCERAPVTEGIPIV